jgi:hypothetical protein
VASTDVGDLDPAAPDGELKYGGLTAEKATDQIDTYSVDFRVEDFQGDKMENKHERQR